MILDATAGNRTMWQTKQADGIIYIDMEKRLEVKPTIFCSNEQTPFRDNTFDNIFYDSPHTYGVYNRSFAQPNWELQRSLCARLQTSS